MVLDDVLSKQICDVQGFGGHGCGYEVSHLGVGVDDYWDAIQFGALGHREIRDEVNSDVKPQLFRYRQGGQGFVHGMGGRFVPAALLALIDVVLDKVPHVWPVVLTGDEVQRTSDPIMAGKGGVMVRGHYS